MVEIDPSLENKITNINKESTVLKIISSISLVRREQDNKIWR